MFTHLYCLLLLSSSSFISSMMHRVHKELVPTHTKKRARISCRYPNLFVRQIRQKGKKKGTAFDEKAKKTCTMPSMRSSPTYCDEKKQRRLQGSAIKYAGARTDGSLIRCFFSMLFYGLTATLRGQREKKGGKERGIALFRLDREKLDKLLHQLTGALVV